MTVYEVGPRDGLRNEEALIPAEVKVERIHRLTEAGLPAVERISFVRPEWVPQLVDADQVFRSRPDRGDVRYPVLVPNPAGCGGRSRPMRARSRSSAQQRRRSPSGFLTARSPARARCSSRW